MQKQHHQQELFVYVLKLQHGKYYVGRTTNPSFRIQDHVSGSGSQWTRIHKPVDVIELVPGCDEYDEDKYTKMYMAKYGIDNVRGGSFVSVDLDDSTVSTIRQMLDGASGCCFKCGKKGHFAADCGSASGVGSGVRKRVYRESDDDDDDNDDDDDSEESSEDEEDREGRFQNKLVRTTSFSSFSRGGGGGQHASSRRGLVGHITTISCCYRCGRPGHYASECYASRHVRGFYLYD